ncbi:hypothetical protein [Nitrosomonas ureae]|uniref:Lipoprotein n=1 Tax=Nitrosomonas ureae TaxID=44577 RepID=A0A1H2F663_9PROT|nr:hypothetical protein [Nitrosomonas ureae]ALQ50439.1 hypothetical protein ATY38_03825 [Nitrosomonas ureae]SDU02866.1 hypothetical protein SAMN05216406_11820 [Nitrosomonas ureae]
MKKFISFPFLVAVLIVMGCKSPPPRPIGFESPFNEGRNSEIPMTHLLVSSDWETLDAIVGINPPSRYICVYEGGFRLRVKRGPIATSGNPTPACVNYGGASSIVSHTVEIMGNKGSVVNFVQGAGSLK